MNHSLYSADRTTHLKIIVVGLAFSVLVAAVGVFARINSLDLGTAAVVKTTRSAAVAGQLPAVR